MHEKPHNDYGDSFMLCAPVQINPQPKNPETSTMGVNLWILEAQKVYYNTFQNTAMFWFMMP